MREQKGLGYCMPQPYLLRYINLNLGVEARMLLQSSFDTVPRIPRIPIRLFRYPA